MRWLCALAFGVLLPISAHAVRLDLTGYEDAQGAITVHYQGDFVDPYFAIKALLSARDAGLDITQPAQTWIGWLLPRQRPDGMFDRYCKQDGNWSACKEADADDALLAMWIELLYVMSPARGMPPAWQKSVQQARNALDKLRNPTTGVYRISPSQPVSLFIDNVEIYASLRAVARERRRMKQFIAADGDIRQAVALRTAIERVFRPVKSEPYAVSTQRSEQQRFYPEHVAQIYPWLHRMPTGADPHQAFQAWMAAYGADWLGMAKDDFPWGLIALAAIETDNCDAARNWQERAMPLRHGARWNVLEEASLQAVTQSPASDRCKTERS